MGLPPALAARLKKRGIIKEKQPVEEEVFAENYDTQVFLLLLYFVELKNVVFCFFFDITVRSLNLNIYKKTILQKIA